MADGAAAAQLLDEGINRQRSLRRCCVELVGNVADAVDMSIAEGHEYYCQ